MFAIIPVSLFSFELIKVLPGSEEYIGAAVIVPILAIAMLFMNMKEVTVYGLHIAKKTSIIGIIVAGATVFGLGVNILLIPVWDITGAAVAYLLSQFIYWLACFYFSQRVFYVPYELGKISLILIVGAILSFSSLLLNGLDLFPRLLLKTACVISFPFILLLFRFYEPVELQAIRGFITKWSKMKDLRNNLKSLKGLTDEP
jgi:O-antigen/teichoic acid export membrane protein